MGKRQAATARAITRVAQMAVIVLIVGACGDSSPSDSAPATSTVVPSLTSLHETSTTDTGSAVSTSTTASAESTTTQAVDSTTTVTPSSTTSAPVSPFLLTVNSLGALEIGMSIDDVAELVGTSVELFEPLGACAYSELPGYDPELVSAIWLGEGSEDDLRNMVLEVFYVRDPSISTPSGARVGMSIDELVALFPERLTPLSNAYTGEPMFDFIVSDPDGPSMRFHTNGSTVTEIQAGAGYTYIEGCA